jgi:hypothetical protein
MCVVALLMCSVVLVACAATNPHDVDTSASYDGHSCYAAFDDGRSCDDAFASATACDQKNEIGLLTGELEPIKGEGCYYFCPDVPNCMNLSIDEVATLLCQYAATNGISSSLALRPLCGPETDTSFGPCCFGVDANTLFD